MERKTISTIGAGPGGLAVAMLLTHKGKAWKVKLLENKRNKA